MDRWYYYERNTEDIMAFFVNESDGNSCSRVGFVLC